MKHKYPVSDIDFGEAEARAVVEVVESKWLSTGPRTKAFEEAFVGFTGSRHAVAVSSCTAALHLALLALDIGPGDEVLVPSYTFVASVNPILYCGAAPVFVDITGPEDLNLCIDDLEAKVTPRTRAVIVVHMAGYPADMDGIATLASRHDLRIIEDACHAIGAVYQGGDRSPYTGRMAGSIGDVGCFSFFANKNLPTGEGGMIVTDDAEIAQRIRLGRSHGMTKTSWDKASGRATGYDVVQTGFNYRCTEFTAALGLVQLDKLTAGNAKRRELVAEYRRLLGGIPDISLPFADRLEDSAHHIMPVLLNDAGLVDPFRAALDAAGVQTTMHYPPVHGFSHIRSSVGPAEGLPRTEAVAAREVTLPLHPLLETADIADIVGAVESAAATQAAIWT